jgi:DNA recombination protein RmuC
MTEVLLGLGAGLLGALIGWLAASLLAARRLAARTAETAVASARAEAVAGELAAAESALTAERTRAGDFATRLAAAEADRAHLDRRLAEEAARLAEVEQRFRTEFENLANRILEEKSARFLAQNQEHLTTVLEPLRHRLGEFRDRIEAIHTEDVQSTAALREQLAQLRDLNRQMTGEAAALTRALKGESKTQGSWGELILERILEKSGLEKGREYETQASRQNAEGARFLPDAVIHLPDNHHLIIDAKVSLTAYERSVADVPEAERRVARREHAVSVRRHVDELSRKDYPGLPGLESPDFVLMFVPVEPALHLALQEDPALFGDAFEKNVVLVSSSTLLITLRAVESVWRRQKQTLNALEIARQAGALHDQFVLFVDALQDVGQRIDQARAACDQAMGRLSTGRGNLVRRTLELRKLGARAEKTLDADLARRALDDGDESAVAEK